MALSVLCEWSETSEEYIKNIETKNAQAMRLINNRYHNNDIIDIEEYLSKNSQIKDSPQLLALSR